MSDILVKVMSLDNRIGQVIPMPSYATDGAAGMDLYACIDKDIIISPGEIIKISTGIAIQILDRSIGGFIFPRSGISSKYGISLANCVGVIDSDYIGEIQCPIINHGKKEYTISSGDRIAQIVFLPVFHAKLEVVDRLEPTKRGVAGFGSTGK